MHSLKKTKQISILKYCCSYYFSISEILGCREGLQRISKSSGLIFFTWHFPQILPLIQMSPVSVLQTLMCWQDLWIYERTSPYQLHSCLFPHLYLSVYQISVLQPDWTWDPKMLRLSVFMSLRPWLQITTFSLGSKLILNTGKQSWKLLFG